MLCRVVDDNVASSRGGIDEIDRTKVEGGANVAGKSAATTDGLDVENGAEIARSFHRARVVQGDSACVLAAGAVLAAELGRPVDLTGVGTTTTDGLEADAWRRIAFCRDHRDVVDGD